MRVEMITILKAIAMVEVIRQMEFFEGFIQCISTENYGYQGGMWSLAKLSSSFTFSSYLRTTNINKMIPTRLILQCSIKQSQLEWRKQIIRPLCLFAVILVYLRNIMECSWINNCALAVTNHHHLQLDTLLFHVKVEATLQHLNIKREV